MKSLKADRLIITYYRDKLRGHRLTAKAKELLLADNPARFEFYLTGNTETNALKSEITRRLRLHRIAETTVTMQNADASVFRDDKPDIFYPADGKPTPLTGLSTSAFYGSREIKEIGAGSTVIRGARMAGVLLADTAAYIVYNTGASLMKWDYKPEMRAKALLTALLCRERLSGVYGTNDVKGLMLGDDMETAYQMMTSTGGVKRSYFVLDGNYDNFLYLPNDHAGETVLRILCSKALTDELNRILAVNLKPRAPGLPVEHDALDDNGAPVLFGYSFDMQRIIRFDSALRLHSRTGTLICFDFQADVLRRYCSENTRFQTIDLTKLERRFFPSE
ncbi:MAG: hypothetical protein LBN02_08700 [Oscillospiraceae bacterium]|nr:hypothetical protein [Oscillospiraceae bacterium]